MDTISDDPNHRFYDGVPDSFWAEMEDMISDLDLAFDEELIDLKKNSPVIANFENAIHTAQERRLSSVSDTVTAAPAGSLGEAILENIKKTLEPPINPKQYQTEAGLDQVSSGELSRDSIRSPSDSEYLPGIGGVSKKKRKKDKHKKKHKKVQ